MLNFVNIMLNAVNLNQIWKFLHRKDYPFSEPNEISDSTSMSYSDIIDVPLEPISFSFGDFPDSTLLEESLSDNQSTQTFRVTPKILVDLKDINKYQKRFTGTLLQLINEEIFEFGMENAADNFVQENLRDNPVFTKEWLNSMFLKYFADIEVTTGLLRIISHIRYTDIYPTGPTMALAALNHENAELREYGIRAFENWSDRDSLEYLKTIKCDEDWLQTYLEQVISDLEECHVSFSKKNRKT